MAIAKMSDGKSITDILKVLVFVQTNGAVEVLALGEKDTVVVTRYDGDVVTEDQTPEAPVAEYDVKVVSQLPPDSQKVTMTLTAAGRICYDKFGKVVPCPPR